MMNEQDTIEAQIQAYLRLGMSRGDAQGCQEADELMDRAVVVGVDWQGRAMALVDAVNGNPIKTDDRRLTAKGEDSAITGGRPPHKPGSTGKVWTDDNGEFYPSVFGLEWVAV